MVAHSLYSDGQNISNVDMALIVKLGRLAKLSNMKYELSNSILICSFVDSQLVDKIEYLNFQLLVISDFLKLKHVE